MDKPEQDRGRLPLSQKKPHLTENQRQRLLHPEQQQTNPFRKRNLFPFQHRNAKSEGVTGVLLRLMRALLASCRLPLKLLLFETTTTIVDPLRSNAASDKGSFH